ncbi:MAG: hypothetical protein ACFFCI_04580, partial [Promethearchaeota archaeon]
MKIKNYIYIRVFFILFLMILSLPLTGLGRTSSSVPIVAYSEFENQPYIINQSVKYEVEINFSLTHKLGFGNYMFKFSRLNNRMPNSSLTKDTLPYQESKLLYNRITGWKPSNIILGHHDKFNNTYDSFNTSKLTIGSAL